MSGVVEGALITEPLDRPEPGVYIAAATDPAYGWLKALIIEGRAGSLGERYEVDGTKLIAVEIPGQALSPNQRAVRYRIGKAFFSAALDDYRDWKEKWWREAIQNAVDAGATQIDCRVEQVPEGIAVSCSDNGRGMDADTIENKFLVGGETTKTGAGGEAGGFGKAKELLILPWIAWSIHSRSARFYGSGDEGVMEDMPYRDGAELRVVMPADKSTSADAAIEFIGKCTLPGVRFTVNGQEYAANLDPGQEIRDFHGKAVLFHNTKSAKRWNVLVRTKGLYMFSFAWLPAGLEGQLTLELVGRSKDLLTANRDGFRDEQLGRDVDQFVRQVSTDINSALEKKKNHFELRFEGSGKFQGAPQKEIEATMLSHLEEIVPQRQLGGRIGSLSSEQIMVLTSILQDMGGGESVEEEEKQGGALNLRTTPDIASALLDGVPMEGTDAVEAAIRQLSWEPDFFMSNKVDGFQPPKMFYPETMTATLRKLAKLWAELCRFVLIQLGSKEQFGVGWIFAERIGAAYQALPDNDEHWLLFNPFKRPRSFEYSEKPSKDDLYNPSDDDDLAWLYASAIHECTHMADGFDEHDEAFAAAFTRNVAKIAGKERQIRAIRKAVLARGPKKEGGPKPRKRKEKLLPLADATMERTRAARAKNSGASYAVFYQENDWIDGSFDTLEEATRYANQYGTAEVRDTKGVPVYRTEVFSLPLASGTAVGLRELDDEWLRTRRQEYARDYKSHGTNYVAFKNDTTQVWDYATDLDRLIRIMESETGRDDYAEIREVATGAPVWRSANFGQSLLAANRASERLGVSVSDVDADELLIGTAHELEHTDDPEEAERIALDHLAEDPQYYSRLAACGIDGESEGPHSWKPNGPNRWGVDVRAINKWLRDNVPFYARVARHRGIDVDIGADAGKDLGPFARGLEAAFPGVRVDQPGHRNYLRMRYPIPEWEPNAKSARQLEAERAYAEGVRSTAQDKIRRHRTRIAELEAEKRTDLSRVRGFERTARARTVLEPTTSVRGDRCYIASADHQSAARQGVDAFYEARRQEIAAPRDAEEARLREDIDRTRDITAIQTGRARKAAGALRSMKRREALQESDDAVERDIDPSLVPVWRRVKRQFVDTPRMSRSEAFLHWVEEHPEEVAVLQEQVAMPTEESLEREQWSEEARAAVRSDDDDELPFN